MIIHTHSQIGQFHTNHNEDAFVTTQLTDDWVLLAVMDGCSMGTESHFASTLLVKLLRKISTEYFYKSFVEKTTSSLSQCLTHLLKELFAQLSFLKNHLHLDTHELLSTLMLAVVDKTKTSAEIIVIGDGLICVDGQLTEFDQDNKPDYVGYHLNEYFEEWYAQQSQTLSIKNCSDLSLASDGIFTFKKFDQQNYPPISETELVDFLLQDKTQDEAQNLLKKKIILIKQEYGLMPSDDLTVIRVLF